MSRHTKQETGLDSDLHGLSDSGLNNADKSDKADSDMHGLQEDRDRRHIDSQLIGLGVRSLARART